MRRAAMVAATIAIAIGGVLAGLVATGAIGDGGNELPSAKQTIAALETAEQATAEAGPHAPKLPVTLAQSCPLEGEAVPTTGIFPRDPRDPPPPLHAPGGNMAVAFASDVWYVIVTGTLDRDAQRWVIGVRPIYPDPCAVYAGLAPRVEGGFYEVGPGPVALTQIDGDTVVFQTADGTTGRLDFVAGTFTTTTPGATAAPPTSATPVAGQ